MLAYTLRRVAGAIPTLLLLSALTFGLLRLAPGGPFDTDHAWPPEVQANIERRYGLDQPIPLQFWSWLSGIALHGDFRESFQHIGIPVSQIISESLPVSALLGGWSLLLALALGIPFGCLAAWKRGTVWDASAMFLAISGISLPSYLVASLLILTFSLWLDWVPPALWDGPSSMILPIVTLASRPLAIIARMVRASMIEALASDYVRTARAKGVGNAGVIFRHALKNSLVPVIALLGPITANLLTGSFLVEVVFQIPGMGKHFVNGVINRDYPLVMGATLTYGVTLIVANLAVDLAYAWADPRIQLE